MASNAENVSIWWRHHDWVHITKLYIHGQTGGYTLSRNQNCMLQIQGSLSSSWTICLKALLLTLVNYNSSMPSSVGRNYFCTDGVWQWINNFIQHFTWLVITCAWIKDNPKCMHILRDIVLGYATTGVRGSAGYLGTDLPPCVNIASWCWQLWQPGLLWTGYVLRRPTEWMSFQMTNAFP